MKQITSLILLLIFCSICVLSANNTLLEYWDFADGSDGDGLKNVNNSGSIGTGWNHNTKTEGDTITNGILNMSGDDKFTRKAILPSASSLSSLGSSFVFEVNFASWDLTNVTTLGKLTIAAIDSSGDEFAQFILEKDTDTTARIRWATNLSTGSAFFRNEAVNLSESSAKSYSIEFSPSGLVTYYSGSSITHTSTANFGSSDLSEIRLNKDFAGDSNTVLSLNSFGLSAVPEPETYGLIFGMLGMVYVIVRTRRN